MTTVPSQTANLSDSASVGRGSGIGTVWDHLKTRLGVFAVTYTILMLLGLAVVVLIPSHYRAEAVLQMPGADGMPLKLTVSEEPSYRNAVLSEEVLKVAAGKLSAKVDISAEQAGLSGSVEYGVVRLLKRSTSVSIDSVKGWVLVSARSGNPRQAADCANAVAEAYVETEKKRAETRREQFEPELRKCDELEKLQTEKRSAHERLNNELRVFDGESRTTFGNDDLAVVLTDLEGKISRTKTELEIASTRFKSLSASLEHLKKELSATPEFLELPAVTIGPNPARSALLLEIARHERELSVLLKRYTEKHPMIIEKHSIISQKKEDLKKIERKVSDTEVRAKKPNPVYLQVKQNMDQAKIKLQEAGLQVGRQGNALKLVRERMSGLDDRAEGRRNLAVRVVGAKSELDRTSEQFSQLQKRLTKRKASLAVPKLTERATPPTLPSGPERGWWTALAFMMAILGAAAATFGMQMVDGSFASAWEIERHLKLPVLGRVSAIDGKQRRRQQTRVRNLQLLTGVLVVGGVVLVGLLFVFDVVIYGFRVFLFGN